MAAGQVDAVIVGADRIAANGDVANKIGTYSLAVLAARARRALLRRRPASTVDLAIAGGDGHPHRGARRGRGHAARRAATGAPDGHGRRQPGLRRDAGRANVTAIVTERGVHRAPFSESLAVPA